MIVLLLGLALAMPADTLDRDLSDYRWRYRLLLVFSPPGDTTARHAQRARWAPHRAGFAERDLRVIHVQGATNAVLAPMLGERPSARSGPAVARALRTRFAIPGDRFAVLLIGKDGTVKARYDAPVNARTLFERIDAMPMRRREMQRQSPPGSQ
ncbi:DUF4174 domain-containing protein [Salisaeta longa]|uniref:DUF4174 domain-containing protein n=1 Tax=Salisaeta longa TaxID=503170 RepID=UPI0004241FEF|nr:DUF4174 domain-containing protein [Salisaeta longa]